MVDEVKLNVSRRVKVLRPPPQEGWRRRMHGRSPSVVRQPHRIPCELREAATGRGLPTGSRNTTTDNDRTGGLKHASDSLRRDHDPGDGVR